MVSTDPREVGWMGAGYGAQLNSVRLTDERDEHLRQWLDGEPNIPPPYAWVLYDLREFIPGLRVPFQEVDWALVHQQMRSLEVFAPRNTSWRFVDERNIMIAPPRQFRCWAEVIGDVEYSHPREIWRQVIDLVTRQYRDETSREHVSRRCLERYGIGITSQEIWHIELSLNATLDKAGEQKYRGETVIRVRGLLLNVAWACPPTSEPPTYHEKRRILVTCLPPDAFIATHNAAKLMDWYEEQ